MRWIGEILISDEFRDRVKLFFFIFSAILFGMALMEWIA